MERQLYKYALLFIVTSLFGYVMEVVGVFLVTGNFQDRGFLDMPLLPIYGFGSVFLCLALEGKGKTNLQVFFIALMLTTAVEYFSGLALEKIFHQRWWDYSDYTININGLVSLWSSIGFGIGGLFVVKYVFPVVAKVGDRLSLIGLRIFLSPLMIVILLNFLLKSFDYLAH